MPFLTKTWYMAAWSTEINEGLLRRRLFGVPVVLYRLSNGRVGALEDRCPHRFAPLSRGSRIGDSIQCGYHGLTFDSAGLCIHNPYNQRVPPGSSVVQAFDVEDKPMIEAAYHNLDGMDFWDRKPVYLGVDAGAARARRAIQNLLAKERRVAEQKAGGEA